VRAVSRQRLCCGGVCEQQATHAGEVNPGCRPWLAAGGCPKSTARPAPASARAWASSAT
jgi:hypothetical protein